MIPRSRPRPTNTHIPPREILKRKKRRHADLRQKNIPPVWINRASSGYSAVGKTSPGFPTDLVGVLVFLVLGGVLHTAGDLDRVLDPLLAVSDFAVCDFAVALVFASPLDFFPLVVSPLAVGVPEEGVFFLLLLFPPTSMAAADAADAASFALREIFLDPPGEFVFFPPEAGGLRLPSAKDFLEGNFVLRPVVPIPAAAQTSMRDLTLGLFRDTVPDLSPSAITCDGV